MTSPITFCISCCNNLNYLKLAVHSVRKYSHFKDSPFIVFAENCDEDETDEWLKENEKKYNLEITIGHVPESGTQGIGGGMNVCAARVKTEFIMFLHADMFVSKDWDLEALKIFDKYPNEKLWVSSQRFQPNLFKEESRPGTLVFPYETFGYKYDDFDEQYFIEYAAEFSRLNPNCEYEKGEGVSGLIRTKDFLEIGGNDSRYSPAYAEDLDLFLRMQLAGYRFILTTNSIIFHFGSRSDKSNFPDDEIKRSDRSKLYEQRSITRFIEKWGFPPTHHNKDGFITFPPNVDKKSLKHLIKI